MNLFKVYPLFDVCPTHAKGCHVFGNDGKEYLDLYGGHAVISIGHSHPAYIKAVNKQINKIGFYSNFIINDLQDLVAKKLKKCLVVKIMNSLCVILELRQMKIHFNLLHFTPVNQK